ncbi:MAG: L-histidine N(alpha)-methyltransferase [Planctomycetes bacterium]|nr:L-histidine N(alpha)-methyltransferase [Planctomycetota bacterium]
MGYAALRRSRTPSTVWIPRTDRGYSLRVLSCPDSRLEFAESVVRGMEESPRRLDCRYLYDEAGIEFYKRICETPEYYLTRTEDAILSRYAGEIRELAGEATLVELGSGNSSKTRRLLDAWCSRGPSRYVPVDFCRESLENACAELAARYSRLAVDGIAATYAHAFPLLPAFSPLLLAFLGSTVGNFGRGEFEGFLCDVSRALRPGDSLLLGIDLVKDRARLEAAYDDAAGWSRRFTLNLFARINRELGAGLPLDEIEYVSFYEPQRAQIEMYGRFQRESILEVPELSRRFRIEPGERILVEISRKFRVEEVAAHAARHRLTLVRGFSDSAGFFALLLFRRAARLVDS